MSIIESLVGVMILGTTLAGLLGGLTFVGTLAKSGREQAQATYIMSETLDTMRLYSWHQLTNKAFLPPTFSVTYGASGLAWKFDTPKSSVRTAEQPTLTTPLTRTLGSLSLSGKEESTTSLLGSGTSTPTQGSDKPNDTPVERLGKAAYAAQVYRGSLAVGDAPVSEAYGKDIKMLTVTLEWDTTTGTGRAVMSTFFTRYGLQGQLVN